MKDVLLEGGTVGKVASAEIGKTVTVTLHDENGVENQVTGKVEEILTDYE